MLDGIKKWWRGVKNRMFGYSQIKDVVGKDFAMSEIMFYMIYYWNNMMCGKAPWVDNKSVVSLKVEHGICREFADVALTEMDSAVSNEKLDKMFQNGIKDLNENLQDGLGLGSLIMKPLPDGKTEYLTSDKFIILGFDDDGKPNDVIFLTVKTVSSTSFYTRTERHYMNNGTLTIENKCYHSQSSDRIGKECALTDVQEWSNITPGPFSYPGMEKMDFGYFRVPLKNRIDGSSCGVSIFSEAKEEIKKADYQYGRIDWEYKSGERAIHVDKRALKHNNTTGDTTLPQLDKRLYRGLDLDPDKGELFKEFSPDMRDESFIRGLEKHYRQIEFIVGLSYGDLSNTNEVDKTATEIRASKQRKYNRVTAIQEKIKECLEDYVDALAFHNGMFTTGYEFTCRFSDSILTDEEAERNQDRQDVSMGVMSLAEYRAKWYGETIEEATKNIPEQNAVVE